MSSESLSHMMQATTKALYDCQQSLDRSGSVKGAHRSINADQADHLLKLMETLVDTRNQLTTEISSARFTHIDPKVVKEMKAAIEMAISNPVDAKVNQVYFSIFGFNSTLWHVLKEMHKLLKTVELLEGRKETKIVRIGRTPLVKRKKRHERDTQGEKEEKEKEKKK